MPDRPTPKAWRLKAIADLNHFRDEIGLMIATQPEHPETPECWVCEVNDALRELRSTLDWARERLDATVDMEGVPL